MHYSHSLSSQRIAQIAGVFIVLPLLGLIAVGIFKSQSEHLFEKKYRLRTYLTQSYGLVAGAPVIMSGVAIGRVESVEFNDRGTIDVAIQVRQRYQHLIREDSHLSVEKSGVLVGETQVAVEIGTASKAVLEDGATIKAIEPQDFKAMLAEFKPAIDSVKAALVRLDGLTRDIQTTVQTSNRALTNVERATGELPEVVASVHRTAASVERTTATVEKTSSTLPAVAGSVKKTLSLVDAVASDVRAATGKLPAISSAAQDTVNNLKLTTETLKRTTRQVSPLVQKAGSTLDDVHSIVKGAKQTFPISVMVANATTGAPEVAETTLRDLRGEPSGR